MGFLDRLFGRRTDGYSGQYQGQQGYAGSQYQGQGGYASGWSNGPQDQVRSGQGAPRRSADEEAIARYRYLLETAPPERIEEAHAEAFAKLTPDQRRQVLQELSRAGEPPSGGDDPRSLARAATRLEMRRPGSLYSTFGGYGRGGMGMGMGGVGMGMGSMLLTSIAGSFIGTSIASEMFDDDGFMDWDTNGDQGENVADGGDAGSDNFADGGGADVAGGGGGFDGGSDFGDVGGGFDGGGFDGGDFGGF